MNSPGYWGALIFVVQLVIAMIGVGILRTRAFDRLFGLVQGNAPIDHPSLFWRIFYRFAIYAECNFVSLIASLMISRWLVPEWAMEKIRNEVALSVVFFLLYPIPLAVILYFLSTKYLRYSERVRKRERMTIGEIARQKAQESESRGS